MSDVTLILGGARSGKSARAEHLVRGAAGDGPALYVATAGPAGDAEMAERIATHRARRGTAFRTVETPLDLPGALTVEARPGEPVLVDCLTLWLGNLLAAERDPDHESALLVEALAGLSVPCVLVSNEVGLGIVPDNALARAFRDHAGRLHQTVAAAADRVEFVAAGLPLTLKGPPVPG